MASFKTIYQREATKGIARLKSAPPLMEKDLACLPDPVQQYLRYTGAVGQPQVQNVHAVISGQMKLQENRPWLTIHAQQYNFYDQPSRFFYISSRLFGVPIAGLHVYSGSAATFQIKLASLIPVVNAYGKTAAARSLCEDASQFNGLIILLRRSAHLHRVKLF